MFRSLPIWLCTACIASAQVTPSGQELRGKAVAISAIPISMNGNSYAQVIVQATDPKDHGRLFRVRLSVPNDQFDRWKAALPSIRNFKVSRSPSKESVLHEFISIRSEPPETSGVEKQSAPAWIPLKGSERLDLPFGMRIPTFQSKDWPEVPVV